MSKNKENEDRQVGQYAYQILSERISALENVVSTLANVAHKHETPEEEGGKKESPSSTENTMIRIRRKLGL